MVISRSHILALIVFTVFFGITVSLLEEQGKPVPAWLNSTSLVFYKMVALLMKLAPIGLLAYFAMLIGQTIPAMLWSERGKVPKFQLCPKRPVGSVLYPAGYFRIWLRQRLDLL